MGNPDLIVVINGMALLIAGSDYNIYNEAVLKAIVMFEDCWKELIKRAEIPEELCGKEKIKEIKVYELF